MALARWQRTIQDGSGNALANAFVEVRLKVSGAPLATIYSDREGDTPLANPFQADSNGFAYFHVLGGAYRIRAYKTINSQLYERIWDWVGIGTNAERDFGVVFNPRGPWLEDSPGDTYELGDVVSHSVPGSDVYAFVSNENNNFGNEPSFDSTTPESDDHWTVLGLIEAPGTPGENGLDGGIRMLWSTGTSGDPGNGYIRGNNATPASITSVAFDDLNADGSNIEALLQFLDGSTSVVKATILIIDPDDPSNWLALSLTAAFSDQTGYWTGAVTYISHGGTLANDAPVSVFVDRTGDKGDTGAGAAASTRVATGTITVDAITDEHILCGAGVCTVNLPPSGDREEGLGYLVVDYAEDAATNAKTVVPDGTEKIAGLDQWVIDTQGDRLKIFPRPDGNGWYLG